MIPAAALAVIAAAHEDARRRGASTHTAAAWALAALARDGWTTTPTEPVPRRLVACYVPPVGDIPPTGDPSRTTEPCAPAQTAGGPMPRTHLTPVQRFAAKITPGPWSLRHGAPGRCHQWTAADDDNGYARFWHNGRNRRAYHFAYELANGAVPPGMEVDHLCRNRMCVNPAHLEAVTHRENVLRSSNVAALRAAKTHCIRGHHLAGDNLRRRTNGTRECRACRTTRRTATPERQAA